MPFYINMLENLSLKLDKTLYWTVIFVLRDNNIHNTMNGIYFCYANYTRHKWVHILKALCLPLNMLNFLNGIIHISFMELSIINFRDIKMRTWSANSIEPGQTARMCLYWWQRSTTFSSRIRVNKVSTTVITYTSRRQNKVI